MEVDEDKLIVAAYYACGEGGEEFVESVLNLGAQGRFDLRAPIRLFRLLREWRPDVLHVHHSISAFWGVALGRLLSVPVVIKTEHDNHQFSNVGQNVLNFVTQALTDRVVCNSEHTYAHFHPWEKRIAHHKSVVIHNGVDVERIDKSATRTASIRTALGFQSEHLVVGSVGRLIRLKNFEVLIRGIPKVVQHFPNVRFLLIGDGPLKPKLENVAREIGVSEYIIFCGAVKRDRVYELLHAMDMFVVPSLGEGFCNAAVEAMAASRPVISADIDTLREVVGPPGVFANPRSSEAVGQAILHVARMDEKERLQLGAACRARAETKFAVKRTAAAYEQVYADAYAGTAAG